MRILGHIEEIVGAVCMGVMVTIAFINVITRYLFEFSFAFTEELTIYLFVWATLMGASIAFREGSHIVVSVIYNRFGIRSRKVLDILNAVISILFFSLLFYYSTLEVLDEILLGVKTEAISLPVWWFTIAMPVSSLLIIFRILFQAVNKLRSSNV
jgi:TRAP-type C4-dicarboxylate transport system permease small subunit